MKIHSTHPEAIKRLKRAHGHLKSIITMLEEERECLEIAQQLLAVEKAISSAKKTLVHDHIDHCLERTFKDRSHSPNDAVREFKEITKYL